MSFKRNAMVNKIIMTSKKKNNWKCQLIVTFVWFYKGQRNVVEHRGNGFKSMSGIAKVAPVVMLGLTVLAHKTTRFLLMAIVHERLKITPGNKSV